MSDDDWEEDERLRTKRKLRLYARRSSFRVSARRKEYALMKARRKAKFVRKLKYRKRTAKRMKFARKIKSRRVRR